MIPELTPDNTYEFVQKLLHRRVIPRVKRLEQQIRFGEAVAARDKLLFIDPTEITTILSPPFYKRLCSFTTHIIHGAWDVKVESGPLFLSGWRERDGFEMPVCIPAENYEFLQSAKLHFRVGLPWEETPLFSWLMANRDRLWFQYDSEAAIRDTLGKMDALYEDIKSN